VLRPLDNCEGCEISPYLILILLLQTRESYLSLLTENLNKNYERCCIVDPPQHTLSVTDMEACAIDMEYEAFTSNTVASLYRRLLSKMVSYVPNVK